MQSTQSSTSAVAPSTAGGRGLSIVLWTLQGLLAALFLLSGAMKFAMTPDQMQKQTSLPVAFLYFIGVCEVLGGIGLVVPAISRILPLLTPIAASGLVIIMIGAAFVNGPHATAAIPLVIGAMAAFVAWCRFRVRPIRPRTGS